MQLPRQPLIEKDRPKNSEDRTLALDLTIISMMTAQLDIMRDRAESCDETLDENAFLFSDALDGTEPWKPDSLSPYFDRLRKRAALPHVKLKELRAFMDTYGQDLGFSLAQAAIRAGHDPAVASRHYTARVNDTDRQLAAALAGLLLPAPDTPAPTIRPSQQDSE